MLLGIAISLSARTVIFSLTVFRILLPISHEIMILLLIFFCIRYCIYEDQLRSSFLLGKCDACFHVLLEFTVLEANEVLFYVEMVKTNYLKVVEGVEWKKDEDTSKFLCLLGVVSKDPSPIGTILYNIFDGIIQRLCLLYS